MENRGNGLLFKLVTSYSVCSVTIACILSLVLTLSRMV